MEADLLSEKKFYAMQEKTLSEHQQKYKLLCKTFKEEDLQEIAKKASSYLGPQILEKDSQEVKIRGVIYEIGRMQWIKNKLLEEFRETKARYEEEKKEEKEGLEQIEQIVNMKHGLIEEEKKRQETMVNIHNIDNIDIQK